MSDTIRERLLRNLEEVDKSLRRSYIAQIIICILYLYLFYSAGAVEDRLASVKIKQLDVKCVLAEFDYAENFLIKELILISQRNKLSSAKRVG